MDIFLEKEVDFLIRIIIAFLLIMFFCFMLFYHRDILPNKFFFDEKTIINGIGKTTKFYPNDSYANTSYFFSAFSLNEWKKIIAVFSFLIMMVFICFSTSVKRLLFTTFYTVCITHFFLQLSKEFIVIFIHTLSLVIFFVCFLFHQNKKQTWIDYIPLFFISIIYFFYIHYFRSYYLIALLVAAGLLLLKYTNKEFAFTLITLVVLYFLFFSHEHSIDKIDGIRDVLNQHRHNSNTALSMFTNLFPAKGIINFFINYCYAFLRLFFPVFFYYSVKSVFLTLFNLLLLILIKDCVYSIKQNKDKNIIFPYFCICLLAGHWLTQILFEPDLGSYLRHLSSYCLLLLPGMYFYDLNSNSKDKKIFLLKRHNR